LVFKFIIRVYIRVLGYQKRGQPLRFTPLIGDAFRLLKSVKEHGDFCYQSKNIAYEYPDGSVFGNAFFDRLHIGVYGTKSIQDVLKNHEKSYKSPYLISIQKTLLGEGLLFAEGALWKKH
jgi:hypothetical protein